MKRGEHRLLLVGPLPPPYDGNSVAFSVLVEHLQGQPGLVVRVVDLSARRPRRGGSLNPARVVEIWAILTRSLARLLAVDLVYITVAQSRWGFLRDMPLIWAAHVLGRRVVAHLHGGNFDGFYAAQGRLYRWVIGRTVARIDAFIILSERLRERFSRVPGLAERMVVAPNGIVLAHEPRERRLAQDDVAHVLYLSNLLVEKGYLDLLEAARLLSAERPKLRFHVHFAGQFLLDVDGYVSVEEMSSDFFRRVADYGLEDLVTYHGVVQGGAKEALLERCHVFVLPTYYRNEGQPLSVLEAMAHGLPVVVTDHAAIGDMVSEGVGGHFVPPRDGRAIAEAIMRIMRSTEVYARMSRANIQRVVTHFTAERYVRDTTSVILRCLEREVIET